MKLKFVSELIQIASLRFIVALEGSKITHIEYSNNKWNDRIPRKRQCGHFICTRSGDVIIGIPFLEKQKSGQWMATFDETKYIGFSFFSLTKLGRSNSDLELFIEGGDQLLQKKKKVITCLAAPFVSLIGRK